MSEYTLLSVSKRLADAEFVQTPDDLYANSNIAAYRSDTLLVWLLDHGDSIEITPDFEGFNCTFWKGHCDYNGISLFLPDALAELILNVLEKKL